MEKEFLSAIDSKQEELTALSDAVWDTPETAFKEHKSKEAMINYLRSQGFTIEEKVGGVSTAFIASYGSGHPEVGFIAEFDAIAGLSQKSMSTTKEAIPGVSSGHGCGHNLYGGSAVTAAMGVKAYLDSGKKGTVKVLGCPAEEGGGGKAYMARAGAFSSLDAVMGSHPEKMWAVRTRPSLACCTILYSFEGRASHAGASPHLGRSALDAVELMNISVNFLREHMPGDHRVHYAITDSGGPAPNLVHPHAEVMYMMRASNNADLKALCERVDLCARGAAMATETTVTSRFDSGSSNLITIPTLQKNLYRAMVDVPLPLPTDEDITFAQELLKNCLCKTRKPEDPYYPTEVLPLPDVIAPHFGSTDTGDISWNCPTVQMHMGCWIIGTLGHSWEAVTQGKSPFAHRAMLYAGKAMALAAIRLMEDPDLLAAARAEHLEKTKGIYDPVLPADVMPPC